ncbi:MAG: hypothetical protein M1838_000983 [Thelocarpon superellum]|nr:MAG: hypothetical protein M1838_000983 [Thelocarpon superellum]
MRTFGVLTFCWWAAVATGSRAPRDSASLEPPTYRAYLTTYSDGHCTQGDEIKKGAIKTNTCWQIAVTKGFQSFRQPVDNGGNCNYTFYQDWLCRNATTRVDQVSTACYSSAPGEQAGAISRAFSQSNYVVASCGVHREYATPPNGAPEPEALGTVKFGEPPELTNSMESSADGGQANSNSPEEPV